MPEKHDVAVRVISQKGTCVLEHKVGDKWVISGSKTPQGICIFAFQSFLPTAQVLMFGGTLPWETNPDIATVVCPDPENPVVFELRRLLK
ncbi:MAG: TIGR04076 family protein [Chloroflexi bacterium]|nr:TIGR04076 family protein [Chloroflexota bacterium]